MSNFHYIDWEKKPITISKEKYFKTTVFSDTHIGSTTAYLPSNCKDKRGNNQYQTTDQEKMEKNLLLSLKENIGKVNVVQFLGDMIEGRNIKSGGLDISNVDVDSQIEWGVLFAESILKILQPKYVLGIDGSTYHGDNTADRKLLYLLSLKHPEIEFYYGQNLKFILGDKLWFLQHLFNDGVSKAGTLEKYWDKIHKRSWDEDRCPDVIGFAHTHKAQNPYQIVNGENPVYGFVCPGQKRLDTHCSKVGGITNHWEIGYIYMEQHNEELWGKFYNTYKYWQEKQ